MVGEFRGGEEVSVGHGGRGVGDGARDSVVILKVRISQVRTACMN